MKWVSTLDDSDLESMKQLINETEKEDEHVFFQGRRHEIAYIKAVIDVLETRILSDDMMDLEINN